MNPQYAPQQYGLPPNPYGGYPNQGMPQPGPPKPQQPPNQQFAPPTAGQNSLAGYGGQPNQTNAPPPQMTAPANNAHSHAMQAPPPSSNFPSQPPNQQAHFPQKPGGNQAMQGPPTSQSFPGVNLMSLQQAPQMSQPNSNLPAQSGSQGTPPSQLPQSMQPNQAGPRLPPMSMPNQQSGPPGQPPQPQGGLPVHPPQASGLPGQPSQGGGLPGQPPQVGGLPGQPLQGGGLPGQPPQVGGLPGQPSHGGGMPGQPRQGGGMPGQPPQGGGMPGQPPQGGGMPGQPPQGGGHPGQLPEGGQPSQPPQGGQPSQPPQGGQPGQHPQGGGHPVLASRPLGALPGEPPMSRPGQAPQNSTPSQPSSGFPGQPPSGFPGQPLQSGFPGQPRPPQQVAPPQQNTMQQPFHQGPSQNQGQQFSSNQHMAPQNFPPVQKPAYPSGPPTMGGPPASGSAPQGPPSGSGFYSPHQQQQQRTPMPPRPGTTFPNPANPENLSGQMAGMNLNGPLPPMGPNQQMTMNGPPQMNQPGMQMAGQRYPNVNGGPAPQMNGIPDPNAPRSPMQHRYPQDNQHMQGGYPPMPSPPGEYPPAPGVAPQFPAAQPSYPNQPYQQQQQRRLDPDAMPSPVQVVMEDQQTKSGIFYTNQKGQLPPLVTTDFVTVDQGNVSPRFMRSTMYNVPITADMMKQAAVPFALVISPMAELLEEEHPPPLVDFGELGPVRCVRCKAYMCPNMQFFDGGRRFLCLLCKASTEVPAEYFQHLDHTGLRTDRYERAELMLGAYDIIATKEYCRDSVPPKPPALIFVIDVSYNNVKSGLVHLLCSQMKSFLFNLPKERGQEKSSLRVGFITYNSSVHFYNINPNLAQPQMLVVGDVQEMFMPLLDGFLADVDQSEALIDMLMEQIPTMFGDTRETETILAPAIQAGLEALKAAGCAGKLLVFHSSLPTFEAPGKLKNRDDRKLLGSEKEKTVLTPQNKVYNDLGQDCVQSGCSVDLYVFNNSYIDLATIGQVARLTGGEIYKYTYFQADLDGDRVVSDVRANVKRLCAFDAIMRVRTSAGIRPTDFYGHFFMSNTTDIELAAIDPDKAVAVDIKHDDKLSEEDGVYIQAALLYTSLCGQRRIRILNLALKACAQMTELYRTCELDTLMNFFTKQAVYKLMEATPKAIRENYIQRSAQILACYRKNCASPTSAGQLILPECMKLLPLYMNCMLKNDAISGGSDMTVDDRWFVMAAASTMDVPSSAVYLYPRLVSLADMGDDMPVPTRCSSEKMSDGGVYLLENGIYMFLWLGLAVPPEWVNQVFGVPSSSQVDTDKNRLPMLDSPLSEKIREIISLVGSSRHRSMRLTMVRQRDKMELVMKHFLVEDKGLDGSASYVDFLCHLHKEIRSIIS